MADAAPGAQTSTTTASTAPAGAPRGDVPESLPQFLLGLLRELPALVSDRVELLSLELRRAGNALATIAMLVVGAAILGVTAWLGLWAVLVGALIVAGLHWMVAVLVAIALNIAVAAWALMHAKSKLRLLGLPATRRHLMVSPSTKPPADPPPEPPVHERRPADLRPAA